MVVSGTTASFTCSASGQPSPYFSWYRDDGLLTTEEEVSIVTSGGRSTVSVAGVGEEEEGGYHCEAVNSLGTASSETAQLELACELVEKIMEVLYILSPTVNL